MSLQEQLSKILKYLGLTILKLDLSKPRPITLSSGTTVTLANFAEKLRNEAGREILKYPKLAEALYEHVDTVKILKELCIKEGTYVEKRVKAVPEEYRSLTLNVDQSHNGRDSAFFMTTDREIISSVSGRVYMRVSGIPEDQAFQIARKVVPEYQPRSPAGVITRTIATGETVQIFNSYIPPDWMDYDKPLPDRLPDLFERLILHLFPLREEREYFFAWLHASLFSRSFVYLVLCGPGGTGKNRLKLVLRALHGHLNTVDGKRSTLVERFNSQLAESTLAWFDELRYDMEMENTLKEIQNDTISIERKGIDATRSTKIYSSLVISNNKPRDNYIAFDARKFAPLQISNKRLETSLSFQEIDTLSKKVEDWSSEHYDLALIAQIGRWVLKHGAKNSRKWPHLEYRGPMFYKLAHTSMARWQKKAADVILKMSTDGERSSRLVQDSKKGFLWSTVADHVYKKHKERGLQFPDFSTVKHFFDIFLDGKGNKSFATEAVPDDIMADFYVKVINKKLKIISESEVLQETGADDEDYSDL